MTTRSEQAERTKPVVKRKSPKSPDLNPLDYYFWNALKVKVYEGLRKVFASIEQLKRRVKRVWDSVINEEIDGPVQEEIGCCYGHPRRPN